MSGTRLQLEVQEQQQLLWCWAACSSTTSLFYDAVSSWSQCQVANAELKQSSCCDEGSSDACNTVWCLDDALARTGNLANWCRRTVSWDEVKNEIDRGRPVCARVAWSGRGAHFVMIVGYENSSSDNLLAIEDPSPDAPRSSFVPFDVFAHNYRSTGTWTHTYMTQK